MSTATQEIYSDSSYHEAKYEISDKALELVLRLRAEMFSRFIHPEDDVLEFGIGPGWNLMRVEARRRVGYDLAAYRDAGRTARLLVGQCS